MPVKEIITFSMGVLASIFMMNGPMHFRQGILETEMRILRELGRMDNWGIPRFLSIESKDVTGSSRTLSTKRRPCFSAQQ